MSKLVHYTRPAKVFYARNININISFDRLAELAEKGLGASMELGDIIVVDNPNQTKRKMMQKTKNGWMIYYGKLDGNAEMDALAEHNGVLKRLHKEIL